MLKTNKDRLVKIAVEGKVAPALAYPNSVGSDGRIHNVPGIGGITYNVLVGDSAFGWAADHIEPAVSSILNAEKRSDRPNIGYNFLACVGNEVIVISGNAKGARGTVVGHHGGVEHVIIDFPKKVLEKLSTEDKFQIRTLGQGLKLLDYPDIIVSSLDPRVLQLLKIRASTKGIAVPVTAVIPAKLMGSGLGETQAKTGDYDMQTSDKKAIARLGLDKLRLGDLVAIKDHDASFGWRYLEGACVIGVVIHGDSNISGHGPGITTIMTSPTGQTTTSISAAANIGRYLKIGRFRKS